MTERMPYYNPELARSGESTPEALAEVVQLLRSPELTNMALANNLTVAMIRPSVGPDANVLNLSDVDAADLIEEQIQELGVVAKFSFRFDPDVLEIFYAGPSQDAMRAAEPRHQGGFETKWDEFKHLMVAEPTTVLVLFAEEDAITKWRDHLGHWNIEANRDPTTIRGRLGVDNFNNLVHGSDSTESVMRELDLIAQSIEKTI